ncbi:MAG TPA: HPr(Ser) kinase/phosphatase [Ignavibacteriaceae bacterium]|jgi:HPr kinase/phosphorylase|nr:HPr(Ser) kinase/phosphatase [Ignavibacteriaceae bacterium]
MLGIDEKSIIRKECIDVKFFYHNTAEKFKLKLLSDQSGFDRKITEQNLHRPGLALAGFVELFSYNRVQVFGNTEMKYLAKLSDEDRKKAIERIFQFKIPCIILTNNNTPHPEMIELSNIYNIPIFGSPFTTTKLSYLMSDFLDDQFAPRVSIHGSLVDVYGVGVMFIGKSGIGKSEIALDLIERGHRLVADDVIILTKKGENILMGSGTELAKHFMEIRGLGIINIEKMFGVRAIRYQKRLEVVVELEIWNDEGSYTRTGLDESKITILDVEIPYIKLPIVPGKNITVISEVISLHHLLKHYNYNAAKVFQHRLNKLLKEKVDQKERGIHYFEHDFE